MKNIRQESHIQEIYLTVKLQVGRSGKSLSSIASLLAPMFINNLPVFPLLQCLYTGLGGKPEKLPNMVSFLEL